MEIKRKSLIALIGVGVVAGAIGAFADDAEALYKAPERGFVSRRPAPSWTQSLLTGNGTMGVMVPGEALDETLYLSHAALYLPREKRSTPLQMSALFPKMRQLCLEGKFKEAGEALDTAIRAKKYEPHLTDPFIGALTFRIEQEDADVTRYQRAVDFMTGEATVTYTTPAGTTRRSTFVSRADDLIVVRLIGTGKVGGAFSFADLQGRDFKEIQEIAKRIKKVSSGALPNKYIQFQTTFATPNPENPVVGYEAVGRIIHKGGSFGRTAPGYKIKDAREILVLIKIRPRLRTDQGETLVPAIQKELEALPADYEKLLAAHAKIHGELMGRASLSLNAPAGDRAQATEDLVRSYKEGDAPLAQIERCFDAGRYNIISSTGYNPPNLQGLWNGCWLAPWGSAMTTDGNLPCAVSFLAMGNTPELLEPYFRYHERFLPGFRENMKNILGFRGFLVPVQLTTSSQFMGVGSRYPFFYWYAGAPWMLQYYYDYWLTTGDRKFLAERAYPLMKETAAFYEDFLTVTGKDGKWVFAPSYSPENEPEGSDATLANNATAEMAAAKQLLRHTIAAARELGCDQDLVPKWEALLARMPAYEVGEDGSFREWNWPGIKDRNDHRHAMHFYPLYDEMPGEIVDNPALVKAVEHSVRARLDYLENKSAGLAFGYAFTGLAAARTGQAELTQRVINSMATEGWTTGMGDHHLLRLAMFNVDVCGGFPYLCASTLVYSDPGLIRFFPARPAQWKSGSIKGLRLRGAITLKELIWDEKGAKAVLVADRDQEVAVVTPGRKQAMWSLKAGQATEVNCAL